MRIMITALLLAYAAAALASEDRMVLANRSQINERCTTLAARGVACKFIPTADIDNAKPDAHLWIPVDSIDLGMPLTIPRESLGFLERASGTEFYAQALLYTRSDTSAQEYYMVRMTILSHLSSSDPVITDRHEDAAWEAFGAALPTATPGSDQAAEYLAQIDAQAAEQASSKALASERAAAQQAYLSSPEYKRIQLHKAAESCRQTIAQAQDAIDHDKRVAAISGYENKMVREQAASMIVYCEDTIHAAHAVDKAN